MKIVYIHGASASGGSFNYIRDHLKHDDELIIEYSTFDGFENNLEMMMRLLVDADNLFFICHSMGGIYAAHLAYHFSEQTIGAVTMSTPYGGAGMADYAKYFLPFSRLLRDIGPNSRPMRLTNKLDIVHPWCNIVTTAGDSPWMVEPNDGVVTIASQKYREDMEFEELPLNHYEVVISPKTVNIIKKKIKEYSKYHDQSNKTSDQ
jgi:pimeloyl-ACP methyl ester carboxylesterase